jgi:opacity protein-like surface antigen
MKKMITAALFAAVMIGCAAEAEVAPQTVNALCPQMGGEVTVDGGTVEWNGMSIGFCCDGCPEKFSALDDVEKIAALKGVDVEVEG